MNLELASDVFPFVWPLIVLLILLIIIRKIESTINPIVVNVVNGLANQAGSNALTYGLMIGYGLSASLQSLAEQATILHWVTLAAMAKVINPCIVAMLAFAAKNDLGIARKLPPANKAGETTPPFQNPNP